MKKYLVILFFLIAGSELFATHNRAGEITYKYISGSTYEITVNIFADPTSPAFRRREIVINYGDGTGSDSIPETIIFPKIKDNIQKRSWIIQHTYPGPGNYYISVTDPNRNGGVDNMINSSSVPFYLKSLLRISPLGSLKNNSPLLLNDPIDDACFGQLFVHNPGAVDPDGDSLAYRLSPSFGLGGQVAPGFEYPSSAPNQMFVDPLTGNLTMDVPNSVGIYNVAMIIEEYRNGILVGEVLRDLQFQVFPGCNNRPPVINANSLSCVEAGNRLVIPINTFDPDIRDKVTLTATGEPFNLEGGNRAIFNTTSPANSVNGSVNWNTECFNSRLRLYNVLLKSEDNGRETTGTTNLTTFKSIGIRVVAPGPKNATASPIQNSIKLDWQNPDCFNAKGYKIYRRVDSSGYQSDSCQTGVPDGIGYSLIRTIQDVNRLEFIDDNNGDGLVPLTKYCYLITKYFEDGDESYVSEEVCANIDKISPIMTKVSIDSTSSLSGIIALEWTNPDTIDQNQFPPPYRYVIEEQISNNWNPVDSTNSLFDTTYKVLMSNTKEMDFLFRVSLYSLGIAREKVNSSTKASSIFLSVSPTDNKVNLNWEESVPWINSKYTIYRKRATQLSYDSIATVSNVKSYVDDSLSNGIEYCYFIEAQGSIGAVISTVNLSQTVCAIPIDNIPPCSPKVEAVSNCDTDELVLRWTLENQDCLFDIIGYRVYRSAGLNGVYELLEQIDNPLVFEYSPNLSSIAGCYYVSAIDSVLNESVERNITCVEYCPIYELPNIITPNGDGINDLFVPVENPKFRYVDSIDFQVYNRWDQLVFETNNPEINWNGTLLNSNTLLSDGVYYFVCKVFESSILDPKEPRLIKGTVTIINAVKANSTD